MKSAVKTPDASRGRSTKRANGSSGGGQLGFWDEPQPESEPPPRSRAKPARPAREVARKVGEEILGGDLNPAEWAAALASSDGTNQQAVAEYARRRLKLLGESHIRTERKQLQMEMRKRHFCAATESALPPRNVLKRFSRRPSRLGILLIYMGFWGIMATLLLRAASLTGADLIFRASVGSAAICAVLAGFYFLGGKPLRSLFAGDRTLGFGSILCGLSLAAALSMMLPTPGPPRSHDTSRATPQEHEESKAADSGKITLR